MRASELKIGWRWDHMRDALMLNLHFMIPGEATDNVQGPSNEEAFEIFHKHLVNALEEMGIFVDQRSGIDFYRREGGSYQEHDGLSRHTQYQWGTENDPVRERRGLPHEATDTDR